MPKETILLFDLARVFLFPADTTYKGELNALYRDLLKTKTPSFNSNFILDPDMLSYIAELKKDFKIYMFTSGNIQNAPELANILKEFFINIFSAQEIGISKKEPEAYTLICNKIGVKPENVLFVDDQETNTLAAQEAGLQTHVYRGIEGLKTKIESLI